MKCESCGKTIPNGSAFCNRCGTKQGEYIPPFEPPKQKKRTKRPNGFGSVYLRGDTWTAKARRYVLEYPAGSDKPVRRLRTKTKGSFKTRVSALEALPALYDELLKETSGIPKSKQNLTISYYWATYEKDVLPTLSKSKQINYKTAYNRLKPFHDRLVSTLTIADLRSIVSDSCKTYYPANDMKTVLTRIYEMAAVDGIASKELPDLIKLPPKEETTQDAFTPEEAQSIWKLWANGNTFAGFLLLMMTTSMMPGELYKLRKEQINLNERRIEGAGIKTKRRKKAYIVFPSFMEPVIRDLMEYNADGETLLPTMTDTTFRKRYFKILEEAGCRRLTPYACRHTTATELYLDPTLPTASAAKVLRHSARMAEHYTHVRDEAAQEAVEHMQNLFVAKDKKPAETPIQPK